KNANIIHCEPQLKDDYRLINLPAKSLGMVGEEYSFSKPVSALLNLNIPASFLQSRRNQLSADVTLGEGLFVKHVFRRWSGVVNIGS
ncbi:hypothetical protein, partial [Pontibacter harenae]|uniref:hypothetical protein n=1 Tax=Pontibacter harenae TaxID=2894083 RepID=UPI001E4E4CAB